MITFLISFAALILGYTVYGRFVEHVFAPDNRSTPAIAGQRIFTVGNTIIMNKV